MLKKGRIILALLCALCLLMPAVSSAAPDIRAIRTVIGRIEQGSIAMLGEMPLIPEDTSGYELLYSPDLPAGYLEEIIPGLPVPEADGSDGMIRCPLDRETAGRLLEDAYAASIGPDGSILWIVYGSSRSFMMVQRRKTLVLMAQSGRRGVPDTDGALKNLLDEKLKISSEPVEGEVRWSPDGRWLFFNDTERWHGAGLALNDPYLLDTQTGDIFLIESSGSPKNPVQGTFRCILNGCFSADGKSFWWYCRSHVSGAAPSHFLMRYDLESGVQETVCELKGAMLDFCEITENRWLLLESSGDGVSLVRIAVSPEGVERTEEPLPAFCTSAVFFPAVRENVLLAATPRPSGGTYLLPLTWDTPAVSAAWYKIHGVHDGSLQEITPKDVEAELEEAKHSKTSLSGSEIIGTANIEHAAAIIGVTDLLLTISLREPVPDSWGGGFSDFSGQVILNTENLKLFPIETGYLADGFPDSLIDISCFLAQGYGQLAIGLFSVYTLPEMIFVNGDKYMSPYGSFMCRSESDPLVLTSVTLKNRECAADVAVAENLYTIRFHIADYPEPEIIRQMFAVPEILTADRWAEVTSAMGKKDQKKFSVLYTKLTPEKLAERADRDVILASYPAAAAEALYVLKSDTKASNLAAAETALEAAGYTAEDYERDMEAVAVPRETNVAVTKNGSTKTSTVRYTFDFSDPRLYPGSARILELAGLCERIGKAVMENRLSADPLPVESVIREKYNMGSIDFYVTVDHLETTGSTLEFTLTVTP